MSLRCQCLSFSRASAWIFGPKSISLSTFLCIYFVWGGGAVCRAQDNLLRMALPFHHVPSRIKLRPSGVVASKCPPSQLFHPASVDLSSLSDL